MDERVRQSPEEISREAAQEYSPRRKPWEALGSDPAPTGAKEELSRALFKPRRKSRETSSGFKPLRGMTCIERFFQQPVKFHFRVQEI